MAAFKSDGKGARSCYAAFKDHYSLFPMSKQVIADRHRGTRHSAPTGKGTIRFASTSSCPSRS